MIESYFPQTRVWRSAGRGRFVWVMVLACLCFAGFVAASRAHAAFIPDKEYRNDQKILDALQQDAFKYFWEYYEPNSGMAYETTSDFGFRPIATGGTGIGIAATVVATDREWISREEAVSRLMKIVVFLRDRTQRKLMHGAFPHWLKGDTGEAWVFGERDSGADIVETSFLMQGLLIARAYFDGPGVEATLRGIITELWEDVEWDWFTNGEENGLYWHWDVDGGFHYGLKILGYNECLITYVLAIASPTHPISRRAYDYWTSGDDYQPRSVQGYEIEASPVGGGPLFLAHYSFIGLDPRRIADDYVKHGYFIRGVKQTLSNRGYCLIAAPDENKYAQDFWGLSAGFTKNGYLVSDPLHDNQTVAPTAAISSMPYTPLYSMLVLRNLYGGLRKKAWGKFGPYDGISIKEDWISDGYLAIDQLPMVCMVENYRTGLLWDLFMSDQDVRQGLARAGLSLPDLPEGFPEAVIPLRREGDKYVADNYEIRRHPDTGMYSIPYRVKNAGPVRFRMVNEVGEEILSLAVDAKAGGNFLTFPQFAPSDDSVFTIFLKTSENEYSLPVRLH